MDFAMHLGEATSIKWMKEKKQVKADEKPFQIHVFNFIEPRFSTEIFRTVYYSTWPITK